MYLYTCNGYVLRSGGEGVRYTLNVRTLDAGGLITYRDKRSRIFDGKFVYVDRSRPNFVYIFEYIFRTRENGSFPNRKRF